MLVEGGTVVVDGVSVTIVDMPWNWMPTRRERFLLVSDRCPSGRASLTYGRYSPIPVTADGSLMLKREHGSEFSALRTVQDVGQYLLGK